jgi:acetylornithine deacetylase/succinyl-diaminopimelate desuccinylase-like protein
MDRNADVLVFALSKFISIPSVSNSPDHREHCRQAAIWLTKCFSQLGASSKTVRALFFPGLLSRMGHSTNKRIGFK